MNFVVASSDRAKKLVRSYRYGRSLPGCISERHLNCPPAAHNKRIRLLVIVPWLTIGGADRVHLDIASGLRNRGWQVDFALAEPHRNEWVQQANRGSDCVLELARGARPRHRASLALLLMQARGTTHVLISNCRMAYEAMPRFVDVRPDIVWVDLLHGQGGANDMGGSPAYSSEVGHLFDKRIVVTDYLRRLLIASGVAAGQLHVIPNGVAPMQPRKTTRGRPRQARVGFVGRLSPEKRPDVIVGIARHLPDVQFLIAGDGPLMKSLRRRAPRNVHFLGTIADVSGFLRTLDAFVLPSEMEGAPISLLEAMSAGVPVVATAVGGIPEVLSQATGLLVEPDATLDTHVRALRSLLADADAAAERAQQARQLTRAKFGLSRMIAAYDQLLRDTAPRLRLEGGESR